MNCDRPDIAEKLVPFVEGALGEPDRSEVGGHLRRCQACQEEAKLVKESILTLKAAVRTGIWKEARDHITPDLLSMHFEDERAREAGFLPNSGLTDAQAKDIRIHLAECADCREELVLLRELEAEPVGDLAAVAQPLPRALRLEIERLYPAKSATLRSPGERTVGLADRLMAWINPKSLVMASLVVVALTFSYSLTREAEAPTAMAPTSTSSEVAMLDKEETETAAAKPKKQESLDEVSTKLGKDKESALAARENEKKLKTDDLKAPVASKPSKLGADAPEPVRQQPASQVRTASADSAPRPAPAEKVAPAPARPAAQPARPAAQPARPAAQPAARPKAPERPRTVVSTAAPKNEKVVAQTPADSGALANAGTEQAGQEADNDRKETGIVAVEPQIVASAPSGGVSNALTREDNVSATEVAVTQNSAPAPVSAAGSAPAGRVNVPASAPNTGTRTQPVGQNRTAVKPPAPVTVPVRSLPGEGEGYAAAPPPATSPAQKAQSQSLSRAAEGIRGPEPVAMSRQVDLGPRAKAVARQFSSNASVLVEEHSDGSVTVTVRPDRPLTSEEKDKLRRMLRSNLNLGDNDTISIRQ